MADTLAGLCEHEDQSVREAAAKALAIWATAKTVPVLLELLEDGVPVVRASAMDGLGHLKAEDAADAIARKLGSPEDRRKASEVLKNLGTAAGPAVLEYLNDEKPELRMEACNILAAIDQNKSTSVASIPVLSGLLEDEASEVNLAAAIALEKISASLVARAETALGESQKDCEQEEVVGRAEKSSRYLTLG
ncbi:MAG: HEAT repeat domain-containing protein [Planctomycetota bacterium]